jgi:hypothetical protein
MKRHIASVAAAGLVMAIAIFVPMAWHERSDALGLIAWIATWPIYPAFFLMSFVGPHRGPEGLPALLDVYILAFVLWWLAIDFASTLFRKAT